VNEKLKFFWAGVGFAVVVRSTWFRVHSFLFLRKLSKELACKKCHGRKKIDVMVRGGTNMESTSVTCDDCGGSGWKLQPAPVDPGEVFFK
jgi:DnaJ-class molecular chaperone